MEYFKTNYLAVKIAVNKEPPDSPPEKYPLVIPRSRVRLGLPRDIIIEKIGSDSIIIFEYLIEQIIRRLSKSQAFRPP